MPPPRLTAQTPGKPSALAVWLLAARPKTLWAAAAPVVVGTALALGADAAHWPAAAAALVSAVLVQIGTNFSNDYLDFEKGADSPARKGPTRATAAGLVTPQAMRRATALTFALAFAVGMLLVWRGGWPVLAIGIASIVAGVMYTAGRYSLAYLGVADLFVLVFFGPVAVGGTYYVQALSINTLVLVAGLGPGLLATAILLVNNVRDVEEDRAAGKKTLVVRLGKPFGVALYAFCVVAAALVPAVLWALAGGARPWSLTTLVLAPLAWPLVQRLGAEADPAALNPLLGRTAQLLVLYSLFFSVGWNV